MSKWKDPLPWYPRERPWLPPWYDETVIYAVRAVHEGTANKGQQQLFWRYLMYVSGGTDEFSDLSFRPDGEGGERETVFAEGRRFVGMMIRKLLRPEVMLKPQPESRFKHPHFKSKEKGN
jgi:hypothetical protein